MVFFIRIDFEGINKLYKCEIIYSSSYIEHIRVSNESWYIILQSNRPILLCKGVVHNKIKWDLIDGVISDDINIASIIDALEITLKQR